MGWLGRLLTNKLGRQLDEGQRKGQGPDGRLEELIEKSWSGKGGQLFDPTHPEGSGRGTVQRGYPDGKAGAARARHGAHSRGPSAGGAAPRVSLAEAAALAAKQAADPVVAAGGELDASVPSDLDTSCCTPADCRSPSPAMHRTGSAPCTIDVARRQQEAARDSATSLHSPTPRALAPGGAAPVQGPKEGSGKRRQQQQQQQHGAAGAARPALARSSLSAALSEGHPPPTVAPVPLPPPAQEACGEKPSLGILSTLSRSIPSSREPSVRGGTLCPTPRRAAPAVAAREGAQRSAESTRAPSSSGRPPSRPISMPGSTEPSQHGRRDALAALASMPPGYLTPEEEGAEGGAEGGLRQLSSMPARCSDPFMCSPGAVSLLSLQLRGPSAAGSLGPSREGSCRPLHRQLSAGGLSAALSQEGSTRGGFVSREGSSRAGAAAGYPSYLRPGEPWAREGQEAYIWEGSTGAGRRAQLGLQAPPLSREGSARGGLPVGPSREGSARGGLAMRPLHPVAEAEAYHHHAGPLPPARVMEGSWTQRMTSYPPAGPALAGAVPPLPECGRDPERSGSSRSRHSSRRMPEPSKQQQRYAVDATQLSAALSALAVQQPPSSPSPPPAAPPAPARPPASRPGSSVGGSVHGRKSVLVGDPDWATQEGDVCDLPPGDPRTVSTNAAAAGTNNTELGTEVGEGSAHSGASGAAAHQADQKVEWNRKFIRRWKAVKKRARIQAMGLRSLWKVNSPSDRHEPDELLVNLPENDLAWPRFWSPPKPGAASAGGSESLPLGLPDSLPRGVVVAPRAGSRGSMHRDPSLAVLLLGEVAEVT